MDDGLLVHVGSCRWVLNFVLSRRYARLGHGRDQNGAPRLRYRHDCCDVSSVLFHGAASRELARCVVGHDFRCGPRSGVAPPPAIHANGGEHPRWHPCMASLNIWVRSGAAAGDSTKQKSD